jgi:aminopeptidase-like protein
MNKTISSSNIIFNDVGKEMYNLIERLYPICRSITGQGVRDTLKIIQERIPLKINEVPSGTKVFDWTIPKEWNIKDAYIKNSRGEKIIDFKKLNLHILNYSTSVNKKITLKELKEHLFTNEDYPDLVPYLTSYYQEQWGFCLSDNQLKTLSDDTYEVMVDSTLKDGFLTYGELYLPGEIEDEVLFSTYVCHPSLCNDNLSGVVLLTFLAEYLGRVKHKFSYRFLFIPETIGAITWLSLNEAKVAKIKYGLVATCVGDEGISTYKRSRIGDAEIDKIVEKVLLDSGDNYKIIDFVPTGSDERQFCSPGFNLPIGSLMRTIHGGFDQYHTSADNLTFIKPGSLQDSLKKYLDVVFIIENNKTYLNTVMKGEPQLGKRGIYSMIGGKKGKKVSQWEMFWTLNFSDGSHSLLDIARRSGLSFKQISEAAEKLAKADLLKLI